MRNCDRRAQRERQARASKSKPPGGARRRSNPRVRHDRADWTGSRR